MISPNSTPLDMIQIGRRRFLQIATLGGAACLLSVGLPGHIARAAGGTDALLLSCMDYRLIDETERYMTQRGMRNKYDHIVLAGASLGALTDKKPAWNAAFWEHLDVALELHNIHKVFIMDHRDCGAYRVFLGEDFGKDKVKETAIHTEKLQALSKAIKEKHSELKVELLLMNLNGRVENIHV